jgi:hypothetical protein
MTVSALARNASGPLCRAAIPESVLSDFKGLRRHFRVSQIAKWFIITFFNCILALTTNSRFGQIHTEPPSVSRGPGPPVRPVRQAELCRNRRGDVGEA